MLRIKDTAKLNISGNATTATTLQTLRTINGTNFNGSANITTTNWGTARTLTIGNTGKSVNGSGNVSWTIAEIGALACVEANGYWGMAGPDKSTSKWIRTTQQGIIPYQSGGHGSLGTSSWPFNTIYANTFYGNLSGTINGFSVQKSVPSNAVFTDTNTWRPVVNNLTSTATDQSLSAAQGKTLKGLIDGKANTSHTHTVSNITDLRIMNVDAATIAKPVQTWANSGIKNNSILFGGDFAGHTSTDANIVFSSSKGSVNLVIDGEVYVKEGQNKVYHSGNKPSPGDIGAIPTSASCNKNWHWSGQSGQPNWMWGGNDGTNMYVYDPRNFNVAWATGAGYANDWRSTNYGNSYLTTGNGDAASWSTHNVILRTHWGLGVRDYTDTCTFLIDARTGNTFAKGYMMATAFNKSSDRRLKEDISPISTNLENMFMDLKPVNYRMIDIDDGRLHNGFIAQEIEEAMEKHGISYNDFSGLLKRTHKIEDGEENIPIQILKDQNDSTKTEYSLSYDEFTALNTHMIQKAFKEINNLKQELKALINQNK